MVVRVHRVFRSDDPAEDLDGAVGYDLVDVHVRLRSAAGLPHDEWKVVVEFPFDDFPRGDAYRLGAPGVQLAEALVDGRGGVLDDGERAEHLHGHLLAADLEVLERALRLRAPVPVGGDADHSHRVALLAEPRGVRAVARVSVEVLTVGHDAAALRDAVGLHELQQARAHAHVVGMGMLLLLPWHCVQTGAFRLTNGGRRVPAVAGFHARVRRGRRGGVCRCDVHVARDTERGGSVPVPGVACKWSGRPRHFHFII